MSAIKIARMLPTPSKLVTHTKLLAPLDTNSDSSLSRSSLLSKYSTHLPSSPPATNKPNLPRGQSPYAFLPKTPMLIHT